MSEPQAGRAPGTILVDRLTKSFGPVHAVRDLSFTVRPGRVTGFLGPNGAGKTTTLRMLLGLVTPTSGTATIGGRRYADLPDATRHVGSLLEASSFHPGRTGRDHLRVQAAAAGVSEARVDEVLGLVGLAADGRRRVGGYSLGMRQRLGLATAMLGDPPVLVLDEPSNGLDPEGIVWLRGLLRHLAGQGRTVLVSSHVLSEVQQMVDDVVIIHQGALIRQAPLSELVRRGVKAVTPHADRLAKALAGAELEVRTDPDGRTLYVFGGPAAQVGHVAFEAGCELHALADEAEGLEQQFLSLTGAGAEGRPA